MNSSQNSWRSLVTTQGVGADFLFLALLWIAAAAVVGIQGDFPLNDDWSFAASVKRLLESGRPTPTDWTSAPILTHSIQGALFCRVFGFSFTALRVSTLLWGLLGVWATYLSARQMGGGRRLALIAALVLAFNPIYFSLSYTFMTDTPFTALMACAALCLSRTLLFSSDLDFAWGAFFSVAAILDRQLGLCIPIAFLAATLLTRPMNNRRVAQAVFLMIAGFGSLYGYEIWMKASGTLPSLYNVKSEKMWEALRDPATAIKNTAYFAETASLYLGLFLFPFTLLLSRTEIGAKIRPAALFFSAVLLGGLFILGRMMPVSGNIIGSSGLGPITLRDVYVLHLPHAKNLPTVFWITVSAMSVVGGGALLSYLVFGAGKLFSHVAHFGVWRIGEDPRRIAGLFFVAAAAIYSLPIAVGGFFDRYLVPLIPLICGAMALLRGYVESPRRVLTETAVIMTLISSVLFSVAGTRDYLTWNRARWSLINELITEMRVPPSEIDGGFEFHGRRRSEFGAKPDLSVWWGERDAYVVAMGEIDGYETARRRSFRLWMPPHEAEMLALRRKSDSETVP